MTIKLNSVEAIIRMTYQVAMMFLVVLPEGGCHGDDQGAI